MKFLDKNKERNKTILMVFVMISFILKGFYTAETSFSSVGVMVNISGMSQAMLIMLYVFTIIFSGLFSYLIFALFIKFSYSLSYRNILSSQGVFMQPLIDYTIFKNNASFWMILANCVLSLLGIMFYFVPLSSFILTTLFKCVVISAFMSGFLFTIVKKVPREVLYPFASGLCLPYIFVLAF
ncbi:MAG: hypothetical protein RR374_02925, partial [Clostridia bacterium]